MSHFRVFHPFSFVFIIGFTSQSLANDLAYSARDLSGYTKSGSLSVIYGDGSAGGEPLEKLKNSFQENSSNLSGFIETAFNKGSEKVLERYEKSARKISIPETERFSRLDFMMADFFTRGSKALKNSSRPIEYVLHRSEAYDSKIKKTLSGKNFEAIYGAAVADRAMNPAVLKTKEELDEYVKQLGLQYQVRGDLSQILPLQFFDSSKPVRLANDDMIILEIGGRSVIFNSIDEISDEDARRASKAYVSLENFHKLDQKLTGQEYKNLGTDWMSKLLELYKASNKGSKRISSHDAHEILNSLEIETCKI